MTNRQKFIATGMLFLVTLLFVLCCFIYAGVI